MSAEDLCAFDGKLRARRGRQSTTQLDWVMEAGAGCGLEVGFSLGGKVHCCSKLWVDEQVGAGHLRYGSLLDCT